jgi:uncharacterized protein YndB with AHSA1/START domain
MKPRELSVHVDAPPEAVFDYVADFSRHPEWAAQQMSMEAERGPVHAGSTFASTIKFMGILKAKGQVVEVERPSRLVYESKDSSGLWRWTMQLTPEDGGTRLTQGRQQVSAALPFKFMEAIYMWPVFGKKMVGTGLQNIKRNVESSVAKNV